MHHDVPRCPGCREDRLIEFDAVLDRLICSVCARMWRRTPATRWQRSVEAEARWRLRMRVSRVDR